MATKTSLQGDMRDAIEQFTQEEEGNIPWASGCSPDLFLADGNKQKLFDVWATHTQDCMICQNALKNINRLTMLAYVAAVVCLCLGVIVDSRAVAMKVAVATAGQTDTSLLTVIPPAGFWWALGGAILFATGGYLLKKFSRLFYVYKFEHAHND